MTFWDLQCFVAAGEELSFTRAAEKLYISQQALSARISYLEGHYQVKLFERTSPLRLTVAGSYLFEYAKTVLNFQESMDAGMQSIRQNNNAVLSIGTMLNRATVIVQQTIPAFKKKHPNVNIRVTETTDPALSTALQTKPFDLLICYPLNLPGVTYVPVYEEQYYICIPRDIFDVLFTEQEQQDILKQPKAEIKDFVRCPFLASNYTTFLTDVFKECCNNAGVVPNVFVECSSIMTRLSLCMSGLGIMFLSKSLYQQARILFREELLKKLLIMPINFQPDNAYRSLGINYLTEKGLSPIGEDFVKTCQELFRRGGEEMPSEFLPE
ncbi:MAG: LysR family transcriptional regulator [Lachnospiraceae bacterium]|nr:LysR family transcriptional regulator [Lachnospiraceae bacterium]